MPFGRRSSFTPPPPADPLVRVRAGLDTAINRLSQLLARFGVDCGLLSGSGAPQASSADFVAESLYFERGGQPMFITLHQIEDLVQESAWPYFRFFLLVTVLKTADRVLSGDVDLKFDTERAMHQWYPALVDAQMMKSWIAFSTPVGRAMLAQDRPALVQLRNMVAEEAGRVVARASTRRDMAAMTAECVRPWRDGLPLIMERSADQIADRLNNVPLTADLAPRIRDGLARLQASGVATASPAGPP